MKEEEAKTKWCPHVRVAFPETTGNRDMQTPDCDIYKCIGSGCMMWVSFEDNGDCGLKTR